MLIVHFIWNLFKVIMVALISIAALIILLHTAVLVAPSITIPIIMYIGEFTTIIVENQSV